MTLPLETYRKAVRIDEIFNVNDCDPASEKAINRILDELLDVLIHEAGGSPGFKAPKDKRRLLQSLLTVRPPLPLTDRFLARMDRLQQWEAQQKGVVDGALIPPISADMPESRYRAAEHCALWQGDITTLKVDAIVNAANANLLGCFLPFHDCIDNAIHSAAGPRLRQDCQLIMEMQGHPEKTGQTKITRGYHLPSRYVLHMVGPVYAGPGALVDETAQLAACYRACLDLGAQIATVKAIAFCSISTGVFGFHTPVWIRWPFEKITGENPESHLIRINPNDPDVPGNITRRSICFPNRAIEVIDAVTDHCKLKKGVPVMPERAGFIPREVTNESK